MNTASIERGRHGRAPHRPLAEVETRAPIRLAVRLPPWAHSDHRSAFGDVAKAGVAFSCWLGGRAPRSRPLAFALVGVLGYALQTVTLWALVGLASFPIVAATLVATELAVLHNFWWHARWTWADRPAGMAAPVTRLVRFNLANGGVSLAGGAALMAALVHGAGLHYLAANLATVFVCAAANFLVGDRWVFARGTTGPRDGSRPADLG